MATTFASLLARLIDGGVHHVLVGGVAVCLHGYLRATRDLDVLIEATPENASRLIDVLSSWGEGHARELTVADFYPAEIGAVRIGETFVLDVFTVMRAGGDKRLDYAAVAVDAEHIQIEGGRTVYFASKDRLIEMKSGTGRSKDESDIAALRGLREGTIQRAEFSPHDLSPSEDEST